MEVWGLPADLTDFVGRQAELDRLLSWADRVVDLGYPPVIISGGPGMGKTSFAVHAGHRLAARFPDGQIFVDLRGAKPHETLGTLLCALGVPEGELPSSLEQRTGLFRVLARDRSVLFVLDNAEDEAQVRPLLAGGGRSLFILASRRTLAGLDAGRRIPLARFGREESLTLLGLIAGWHRVDAQPREATEVARACGRLPLALRIAGNRLAVRPGWAFRDLAHRLRDERTRLSWLVAGDLAMRPALRTSYDRLGPTAQRLFRRLSIAPDGIATVPVAAALLEPDGDCAELVLEELVDASLLASTPSPDRYRLEGPLRLLAHELLHQQEPVSLVFRLFAEMGATAPFGGAAVTSAPRSSSPSLLPSGRFAS
ncbi:hypothetical protein [Micromonospora sp. NPDC092111]|uniref:hypothetical protein n=1 Tax=Micromonospora sp. NPDC092111 TaxID=3364289 RepID=UPI003803E7DA